MSEEMFYDDNGKLIETRCDLWDFDENTQERIKKAMKEIGFDNWIDMNKAFIPREEEMDVIEFDDVMRMYKEADAKNKFIKDQTVNKIESPKTTKIKDIILDSKVKYSDTIEHIHLSKLIDIDESINFFPPSSNEEFLDLMENIENYGILTPLMVIKSEGIDKYTVVCGRSRLAALNYLYNETKNEAFLYAPCLILDSATDPEIIQGIIISSNLNYKKLPKDIQIKAVLLLDSVISKTKAYRTQANVTDPIADRAGISRTTTNTLRGFKNLSAKALDLLYKDHITRGAARILSIIEDKETQDMIIDKLGNQINDIPKLRQMLLGPGERVYDPEVKATVPETWEKKIDRTMRMVPGKITITLHVDNGMVEDVLKALIPLRGRAVSKYHTFEDGEINKYFKIILNDNHIEQYLRKGFVTKGTINLATSGDYKEVIKHV